MSFRIENMKQRDEMRLLYVRDKGDEEATVVACARSEQQGDGVRRRDSPQWDSSTYARGLMRDGKRKGRLNRQLPNALHRHARSQYKQLCNVVVALRGRMIPNTCYAYAGRYLGLSEGSAAP